MNPGAAPGPASGELWRTFVAVFPPPDVIAAVEGVRARLEPLIPGLRWTAPGNIHFTLRFFGDLGGEAIAAASAEVEQVTLQSAPFPVALHGVGVFGSWNRPRVLWVGVTEGKTRLEALARELDRGFAAAGLDHADKPFAAHLTLGRWRDARGLDLGPARAAADEVGEVAGFPVGEVQVVRSTLQRTGSRYDAISRHGLRGGGR